MANIKDHASGRGGQAGVIRMFRDQGDGTYTVDESGLLYAWDATGLTWVRVVADSSGRLIAGSGKTLLFAAIAQGAAGSTTLVSADTTKKIKVVSYAFTMSAIGTAKFTDGTADLTGAFDITQYGGLAVEGDGGNHLFETAAVNRPLNIVTTGGAAKGHIAYFLEA